MPSLLSRFLGKKKGADQSPLLDGEKYESVPKVTSPSAASFDAVHRVKSKGKEQTKRPKRSSAGFYDSHLAESAPILSLSLPDPRDGGKKSQGLGVVFEGITEGPQTLDDEALGEKLLIPSETLGLVQKTSEVLTERGLETLGVMRPHWFASPRQQESQLKLIHRFLATLDSQKTIPPSPSPESAFESELRYSRDPHDVAAVLRWGLRHLQLENKSFGSSGDWYRTFADKERSGSYPVKAFDDILVPLLPSSHTNLLRATLEMVSSLAAHSEENGISGNKLSKVLGWWIVSNRNVQNARWPEFYAHWEDAARQFEHLFLAYIRSQDAQSRMPKRLSELVRTYPYVKNRRDDDGIYLPRSQFSTRRADALFVQVTVDKSAASRPHPLRIVEDAFRAVAEGSNSGTHATFWEELRKMASQPVQTTTNSKENNTENDTEEDPPLNLSSILADESIRLFSLVPTPEGVGAPTLSLFTPLPAGRGQRSFSFSEQPQISPIVNGRPNSIAMESTSHSRLATSPSSPSQGHNVVADWQVFSNSGFNSPSGLSLAASLWDNDTEISQPVPKRAGGISKRGSRTGGPGPRSVEQPQPTSPAVDDASKPTRRTYDAPRLVKLDEAFIDFWADSLLDSIARTWPTFVVCQLKPLPALKRLDSDTPLEWLIIERVTERNVRLTPLPITTSSSARAASPLPSPTKSEDSRTTRWASSTLSSARKRLSFFSPPKHDSAPAMQGGRDRAAKKAVKDMKVGEMGEILKEEDEHVANGVRANGFDKVPDKHQEAPGVQANGVPVPEETIATIPKVKDVNQVDSATPSEPTKETSVPKQPGDAPSALMQADSAPKSEETVDTIPEVKDVNQVVSATPSEPISVGPPAQPSPSPTTETSTPKQPTEATSTAAAGSGASVEQVGPVTATSAEATSSSKPNEQIFADSIAEVSVETIQPHTSGVADPTTDDVLQANENGVAHTKAASDENFEPSTPQPNEPETSPQQNTHEPDDVGREPTAPIQGAAKEDTALQGEPMEETGPEEPVDEASL